MISGEEFVRNTKPLTPSQPSAPEKIEAPTVEVVPIANAFPSTPAPVVTPPKVEIPEPPAVRPEVSKEAPAMHYGTPSVSERATEMPGTPSERATEAMNRTPSVSERATKMPGTPSERATEAMNRTPSVSERATKMPGTPSVSERATKLPGTPSERATEAMPPRQTAPPVVTTARVAPAVSSNGSAARDELSFTIPGADESFFSRLSNLLQNVGDIFKNTGAYKTAGGDFHFLLEEESLSTRIRREFSVAWADFRRDPKRFVIELIRGEGSNRTRRNMMLAGSEMALVGYVTIYFISQIISSMKGANGWMVNGLFVFLATYLAACYAARGFLLYRLINSISNKFAAPKFALEVVNWAPLVTVLFLAIFMNNYKFYCYVFPGKCILPEEEVAKDEVLIAQLADIPKIDLKESAAAKEKSFGGSKPKPKPASGGGGGGRQQPTPPSKGVPPQMALTPQIIPPNPEPPKIKNPSLIVASTVYGDPSALPPMKGPIGDPTGVPAPPSSGPGTGAGIGRGAGTGVGGGDGGGVGPGRGGNVGGGDMGLGGGGGVQPMSAALRPTILYKEKAKYTEEARQNKVQGTVVLNVVFTADGRISNIRVVRGLPDGLTEKAIEAAQKIRFRPAVRNGSPVSVRGNLEFTFNLY
ncbi:MAG: TonB family protein [Acidobacteriota bacterium]|nr:MAG: TonB family protein [Acidobacteriota bacterium]